MNDYCRGDVRVSNVSFSYPVRPEQLVLRDVTMDFPAGGLTFVIGKSGSGKSTIGQLLAKFYQASEGDIMLDGKSYRQLDSSWIRKHVLLVEQSSVLFEESVERNIAYGRKAYESVTEEEMRYAAQFAALEGVIQDMPNGYQTVIAAKGNSLSGGQRQRMALARAKIRDQQIIILDESTSALDYVNRAVIMEGIRKWRQGKTTIIITHDISQIRPDDFVYILKDGKVVQEGYRKAMAAIPSSPFQAFVNGDDDEANEEVDEGASSMDLDKPLPNLPHPDLPKHKPRPLSILSPITTWEELPSTSPEYDGYDPLDYYLTSGENERESRYIPSVFTNRVGSRSQRDSMRMHSIVSPFWIVMPTAKSLENPGQGQESMEESFRISLNMHDGPNSLASLVERTGRTARDSRRLTKITDRSERSSIDTTIRRSVSSVRASFQKNDAYEMMEIQESQSPERDLSRSVEEAQTEKGTTEVLNLRPIVATIWPNIRWRTRVLLVHALFWLVVWAVSTPVFSFVFAKLLSTFYIPEGREHKAMIYSLSILGIAIVDSMASFIYTSGLQVIGQIWVNTIRVEAFRRILEQPRDFFSREGNEVSRMAEILDSRAEVTQTILGRFVPAVLLSGTMMSVAIVWSMISSWKLTLAGAAAAPVMYLISMGFEWVERTMSKALQDKVEVVSGIFYETFTAIRTVKSLALEDHFRDKFSVQNEAVMKIAVKRSIISAVFFGLSETSITYLTALLFHLGAVLASQGTRVTSIITVFTELLFGFAAVQSILNYIPQMSSSRDAASRLLRLSRLAETCHEHEGKTRITHIGEIGFHDLNFRYPSRADQRILKDLNLSILPGSCVALVGSSGSGKSTIASLLLNLYTPDTAPRFSRIPPVTLAGRNMKNVHTPTLRSLITIVSQTPFLFPATIEENITYGLKKGSPYRSITSVRAAATAAGVDDFIMSLPQGYATEVGDGGMGISGGQAQRISIARALVRKPNVLILDEATSALDVESAAIVRESVLRLIDEDRARGNHAPRKSQASGWSGSMSGRGLTVIIITHAKEMMNMADKIVMLDRGRVVDQGPYDELVAKRGPFYRLLNGEDWGRQMMAIKRRSLILMKSVKGVTRAHSIDKLVSRVLPSYFRHC